MIYDTLGEYSRFGVVVQDFKTLADFWYNKVNDNFKICYQPANPAKDFSIICELVFSCGDMTFYVEEIDTFLSINPQGLDDNFLNIVQRGRHKNIELIGITQRPYSIPALLRSQAKVFYIFNQTETRDIDYLKMIIGNRANEIRDLPTFHYIMDDDGTISSGVTSII